MTTASATLTRGHLDRSAEPFRTLICLQEPLSRTEARSDRVLMEEIFARDFYEFGLSGRAWQRAGMFVDDAVIDAVLPLPDLRITLLEGFNAMITYASIVKRGAGTQHARRCSLWSLQHNHWKLRYHQGTPFEPDARTED